MPKLWNLPMTTSEPISDAKAREFLLPSSSWGSHRYWRSSYREEPWALGYIAYIGYSRRKNSKIGSLRVWLVTFWWRVRCWVLIGSPFPGLTRISRAGQGFWLVRRWWGEVRDFQRLFSRNLIKWSSFDSSLADTRQICCWGTDSPVGEQDRQAWNIKGLSLGRLSRAYLLG